jgi:hypothetical protein
MIVSATSLLFHDPYIFHYFSSNRRLFGQSAYENFVEPLIVISHPVRLGSSVVDRSVLGVKFWNFG